jgi:hypothetical protein
MAIDFTMTAGDLVTRAMQTRRCLALGRTPSSTEMTYGLERLNLLLKPLARYEGTQWVTDEDTATITAGDPDVELDPRPGRVVSVGLSLSATNERPLVEWEAGQFDALPNKISVGDPVAYVVREAAAGVTLRVWPVPSVNRTLKYRYIRVPEDVERTEALDVPQDWLADIELVLADDLSAFANGNPDLPAKAAFARRMMQDRARPRSYFLEPWGQCA